MCEAEVKVIVIVKDLLCDDEEEREEEEGGKDVRAFFLFCPFFLGLEGFP